MIHHSIHEIELLIQNASDAADMSRQYAARAKQSADEADRRARSIDVVHIVVLSVGISLVLFAGMLALVKHDLIREIQQSPQQVQTHDPKQRK